MIAYTNNEEIAKLLTEGVVKVQFAIGNDKFKIKEHYYLYGDGTPTRLVFSLEKDEPIKRVKDV